MQGFENVFFLYSDREQLVEAKSEKIRIPSHIDYWFPDMQLIMHMQMYADTHTQILLMVFAIQGVKTTCMYICDCKHVFSVYSFLLYLYQI